MEFKTFNHEITIKEHHLDTFGHVNNATYLQLLEQARWEFTTERGYGVEKVQSSQQGPTILEVSLRFKKELINRQKIRIESYCSEYKGKVSKFNQKIFNMDNELCCEANFTFALFDLQQRKLIPPTPEWLYAIGVADS